MKRFSFVPWLIFGLVVLTTIWKFVVLLLDPNQVKAPVELAVDLLLTLFVPVAFAFLAALIISRQPRNLVGWLMLLPAIAMISDATVYVRSFPSAPTELPLRLLLTLWTQGWGWILLIFPVILVPALFPTGRPLSPRWRWPLYLAVFMFIFLIILGTFISSFDTENFGMDWTVPNPLGFIPNDVWQYIGIPWVLGLLTLTYRDWFRWSCASAAPVFGNGPR